MQLHKVSTREFRNNISQYLSGKEPIAVLKHGQIVGYYFPVLVEPDLQELESLKLAAKRLDDLLKSRGITEDELVEDFRKIRQQNRVEQNDDC